MRSLRDLSQDFITLREIAEDAPEEMDAVLEQAFAELHGDLAQKMDNCSSLIAEWQAQATMYKAEIQRLAARKKTIDNNTSRLKARMILALQEAGEKKTKGLFAVSLPAKTQSIAIDCIESLPIEFVIMEKKADKRAIKDALKSGPVVGAHIEETQGINIR